MHSWNQRCAVRILAVSLLAGLPGVLFAQESPLPTPTGHYAVGRTHFNWTDEARADPEAADGHRRIVVWIWYPASTASGAQRAEWVPGTWGDMHAGFRARFRKLTAAPGSTVPEPPKASEVGNPVPTHAFTDAAVASEASKFPILLFSPGWGELPMAYATVIEEIASHGYVVAGIVHTYYSRCAVFDDGSVAGQHEFAADLPGAPRAKSGEMVPEPVFRILVGDLSFALDQLEKVNADSKSPLQGRLDLERVGVFGHSIGGGASLQIAKDDPRVDAVLALDPGLFGDLRRNAAVPKPLLAILASSGKGRAQQPTEKEGGSSNQGKELINTLSRLTGIGAGELESSGPMRALLTSGKPGYEVIIAETTHGSFMDYRLLPSPGGRADSTKPARVLAVTSAYLKAFFDRYLKGRESPLLGGPSPDFPEATFEKF